ncbi:MAG TPA: hypothetical protein VNO21_07095, partial [Polyangiaceae bacterium]|nr:hypothetical protein [Polyangiaceae bacterium]
MSATSTSEATALAHPNIALAKYWGKRSVEGNYPAVPSLSVTLDGMSTRTRVRFDEALAADRMLLNGAPASQEALARAVALLDRVRKVSGERRRASIESVNDFPTASGLASSASGFAALALAAVRAAGGSRPCRGRLATGGPGLPEGLDWSLAQVSDLARQSSASAARSLFDGFVELEPGGA